MKIDKQFKVGGVLFVKGEVNSINLQTQKQEPQTNHWAIIKCCEYKPDEEVKIADDVIYLQSCPYKWSIFPSNTKDAEVYSELVEMAENITGLSIQDLEEDVKSPSNPQRYISLRSIDKKIIIDGSIDEAISVSPFIIKLDKTQTVRNTMRLAGAIHADLTKSAIALRNRNIMAGAWIDASGEEDIQGI